MHTAHTFKHVGVRLSFDTRGQVETQLPNSDVDVGHGDCWNRLAGTVFAMVVTPLVLEH